MTHDEQLAAWINGDSRHGAGKHKECCPDFSCCRPELLAPKDVRQRFVNATEDERHKMLFMFLGAAMAGKSVYLAGDEANYTEEA